VAKRNVDGPELVLVQKLYGHLLQNIADADQLVIEKGDKIAGKVMQEFETTHEDENRVRSSAVVEFLQRALPFISSVDTVMDSNVDDDSATDDSEDDILHSLMNGIDDDVLNSLMNRIDDDVHTNVTFHSSSDIVA
jgi:hypothetical protein